MYDIDLIADFFLSKASMSPKKLQKLLYYAYAWTLALLNDSVEELNNRLFTEPIQAWVHGPVIPSIYAKYRDYGWNDIPRKQDFDESKVATDVLDVLNQVWEVYGGFSGNQLEQISHQEDPWVLARKSYAPSQPSSEQIPDAIIFTYYNDRANANV